MALQLATTVWKGITLTNSYHKVLCGSGSKKGLEITVGIHADSTSDTLDVFRFFIAESGLVHDGSATDVNYTAQAYAYMKANVIESDGKTHDYTNATDV
jgi:hypothetical protein